MIKARKRFVLCALAALFAILAVLLGIINGTNLTLATEDADRVTQMLSEGRGQFPAEPAGAQAAAGARGGQFLRFGPMGPDSPETEKSMRWFTFAFDEDGNAERVAWSISAVTEEEALEWARSLLNERETGWTRMTYRYRIYEASGKTYVTVIDQGREMQSVYRILWISLIGLAAGMAASALLLMYAGRRLFRPLEETDRKQKRFLAEVEKEFKLPLTIINTNTEIMERTGGQSEQTDSINRQVKRMIALVKDLASMNVFDERDLMMTRVDLAPLATAAADAARPGFEAGGRGLTLRAESPVYVNGDGEALGELLAELLQNAQKFSVSWASLELRQANGHTVITSANDTPLPDGSYDQAFDRFTRLSNAKDVPGNGLGLSHVKDVARAHNGRVSASAAGGVFTVCITL